MDSPPPYTRAASAAQLHGDGPGPGPLLATNFGFARARVLGTALELGVFTALAGGTRDPVGLADALQCSREGMTRLLGALAELGLVEEREPGTWHTTAELEPYLVPGPACLADHLAEVLGQWDRWAVLTDIVRSGVSDGDLGDLEARHRHAGMFAANFPAAYRNAAAFCDLPELPSGARVLNVHAGAGEWGIVLASRQPDITVVAHDVPGLLRAARARVAEFGLADRFAFQPATATGALPQGGFDAVVLAHVGRFIGRTELVSLLRRCHGVIRPGGRLLLADVMRSPHGQPTQARSMLGLSLLVNTRHGGLMTEADYSACLEEAGFLVRAAETVGLMSALTAERY